MIESLLKPLAPAQKEAILQSLPKDSLYYHYIYQVIHHPTSSNQNYASAIGLGENMNEFYQIKHQAKEMIEDQLFETILLESTRQKTALKYALLSKFYFGKVNHELGRSYLNKALAINNDKSFQGFQLDVMNSLFLDLTERFSEDNLPLIDLYSELNENFHAQTAQFINLAKKLHSLIKPTGAKSADTPENLIKDLNEINEILDKLPMDAAVFKLEYRFAEIYLSKNQQVGDEFLAFYIQLYQRWKDEDFFNERNQDQKLKSIVNISFLLLSNQRFELGKTFLDELGSELNKFGKAYKSSHEIYLVSFLAYYYFSNKAIMQAKKMMLKFERKIDQQPLQTQTLYFFYHSLARVLFYTDEFEKCVDIIAEINDLKYKSLISASRKINWAIFEFLCHYHLKNYTYCKNVLQKIRSTLRNAKTKNIKPKDVQYFKVVIKIFNAVLRNVGYIENIDLSELENLFTGELKNPMFYDKIINLEDCVNALKLNKSLASIS